MNEHINVPWSQVEVDALNAWQNCDMVHAYTCGGNRMDAAHRKYQSEHGGDFGQLVATTDGWMCPACDYRQNWAHGFSAQPLPAPPGASK